LLRGTWVERISPPASPARLVSLAQDIPSLPGATPGGFQHRISVNGARFLRSGNIKCLTQQDMATDTHVYLTGSTQVMKDVSSSSDTTNQPPGYA
jgi:hypothetical protein